MRLLFSPLVAMCAAAPWTGPASAQGEPAPEPWNPVVVTPTGQASRVSESPSTTFVITGEEIRRSGASSLPEILRRVPGLDVRILTATDGQLGLRGFAFEIAERVLVLVDGRTAYVDFFGGTAYEMLPVSLVDIDRIEVVLGPGASVYGNKAMLGTINILTRQAADYPFAEARVDAGPPGDGRLAARHGAIAGPWRLRATALARRVTRFDPDHAGAVAGGGTLSATYSPTSRAEASIEVGSMSGETYIVPTASRIDAFDATLAYVRAQGRLGLGGVGSPLGDLKLDLVWNGGRIRAPTFPGSPGSEPLRVAYHTPYVQLIHDLRLHLRGVPMQTRWGGEVRLNTIDSTITARERALWNVAAFASNEIMLGDFPRYPWRLTTGLRLDQSTLTRMTISPRLSVVWSPAPGHQLRAAINAGYNNPNLLYQFARFDLASASGIAQVRGDPDLSAEHAWYGELGWAGALTPWLRASATSFVYRLTDWITLHPPSSGADPVPYGNNDSLVAHGGELGLEVGLRRDVSAYASYAFVRAEARGYNPYCDVDPHGSPRHKAGAGLRVDLQGGAYVAADAQYFGSSVVARLPDADEPPLPPPCIFKRTELADFVMANVRLGYAFREGFDLSLAASNALDDRTRQFPGGEAPARRVSGTVAYYH